MLCGKTKVSPKRHAFFALTVTTVEERTYPCLLDGTERLPVLCAPGTRASEQSHGEVSFKQSRAVHATHACARVRRRKCLSRLRREQLLMRGTHEVASASLLTMRQKGALGLPRAGDGHVDATGCSAAAHPWTASPLRHSLSAPTCPAA
ncbi:hypothetical protein MRX96_033131 [Rhipicephalus microplus]